MAISFHTANFFWMMFAIFAANLSNPAVAAELVRPQEKDKTYEFKARNMEG